jgi:hypothetical protein
MISSKACGALRPGRDLARFLHSEVLSRNLPHVSPARSLANGSETRNRLQPKNERLAHLPVSCEMTPDARIGSCENRCEKLRHPPDFEWLSEIGAPNTGGRHGPLPIIRQQ